MLLALSGAIVTVAGFVLGLAFKMGQHSARIEALEQWRTEARKDMHEISETLGTILTTMSALKTLVEERTDRRFGPRPELT